MKITRDMSINEVIAFDEEHMLRTLAWLSPMLGRLQYPNPRRDIIGRISVDQAARLAGVSAEEALFVLNLAAGEKEEDIARELSGTYPAARPSS